MLRPTKATLRPTRPAIVDHLLNALDGGCKAGKITREARAAEFFDAGDYGAFVGV